MRARLFFAAFGGLTLVTACTSLLGSFEVGGAGSTGGTDGDTTTDSATAPTEAGVDTGVDAPPSCKPPEVPCGKVCANLDNSTDNCGVCGRSCGGGTCTGRRCSVDVLFTSTAAAVGPIDVGLSDVVFATDDNKLQSCPKNGCKQPPKQLASMAYGIRAVHVINVGTVTFLSAPTLTTERPAVFACPIIGCVGVPNYFVMDGLNGIAPRLRATGDRIFFSTGSTGLMWSQCQATGSCGSSPTGLGTGRGVSVFTSTPATTYFIGKSPAGNTAILSCPNGTTACAPTLVLDAVGDDIPDMDAQGTTLTWIRTGRAGFNEGRIRSCDVAVGCAPKDLANGLAFPTEVVVDASGTYVINQESGKIARCPPNGCVGGAQDFTQKLDEPHSLVLTDNFIYWAEQKGFSRLAK